MINLSTIKTIVLCTIISTTLTLHSETSATKNLCQKHHFPSCLKFSTALESKTKLESALAQNHLQSFESTMAACQTYKSADEYWCHQLRQADDDIISSSLDIDNDIVALASVELSAVDAASLCHAETGGELHCNQIEQFVSKFKAMPVTGLAQKCENGDGLGEVCALRKELAEVVISAKVADRLCSRKLDNAFCTTLHFAQQYIHENPKMRAKLSEATSEDLCDNYKYPFCDKDGSTMTQLAKFNGRSLQKLCTEKPKLLICKTIALAFVSQVSETFSCIGPGSSSQICANLALAELELKVPNMNEAKLSKFSSLAKIKVGSLVRLCKKSPKMMICSYVTGNALIYTFSDPTQDDSLKALCLLGSNLAICDTNLQITKPLSTGRLVV